MEEWKIIQAAFGLYEVSNRGRIRNTQTGHILKPSKSGRYDHIDLTITRGKRKHFSVHRLVAEAFVDNPHGFNYVNHKDEDKKNNNADNLEWCTCQYNVTYGKGGLARYHKVTQMDLTGNVLKVWDSLQEAAESLGTCYQNISQVCRGRRKTAVGYRWGYTERRYTRCKRKGE